ncbi:MAG: tRNA (adenosine(37)-N6)-threonylcarbamoyltransferase complex transferase subunit TsaD [Candidatus Alcyoniella australis]|nr:tRNA (adenosine(37)-N6)-threonylcarbamoyltransferase complex transferase subunit TsaD [Candidatus Alcyoniella australis]
MIVLGIETSCDETAAALVDGRRLLSSVVASQVEDHRKYGGVVPEIASRLHIQAALPVISAALERAGIGPEQVQGVAATRGPGLIGAVLVGLSLAKAFAAAREIPMIGVNHVEAHLAATLLLDDPPQYPYLGLVISGGHSDLYVVRSFEQTELLAKTLDDAAGEAFDKVGQMLGLPYPGGPEISRLAEHGDPRAFALPRPRLRSKDLDFSFSGLKTDVRRTVQALGDDLALRRADLAASFEQAVIDVLIDRARRGARDTGLNTLVVSGGVAANRALRRSLAELAQAQGLRLVLPPIELCTDNAAMVAAAGAVLLEAGRRSEPDLDAFASLAR